MKRIKISGIIALLACSLVTPVVAEERGHERKGRHEPNSGHQGQKKGGERVGRDSRRGGARHKDFLKKFDLDKDGELSAEERKNAHASIKKGRAAKAAQMKRVRERFLLKFDEDGDGEISKGEKEKARKETKKQMQALRDQLTEKYDADGDGKLSGKERKAAHLQEKQEMLKKYDNDADGELNEVEKKAAFEYMLEHEPYRLMHQMRGMQKGRDGQQRQRSRAERGERKKRQRTQNAD